MMFARLFFVLASIAWFWAPRAEARLASDGETVEFAKVRALIDSVLKKHAPERVLVALDIDNTTLAFDHDIGGEHWFQWQTDLIESGRLEQGAVAENFDDLLAVSGWISHLRPMRLVEPRIANDVRELAAKGVRFMVLTSRGYYGHDVTLRELKRNGLDMNDLAPGPRSGFPGVYLPYDVQQPTTFGLNAADIARFQLKTPRLVSYVQGVMLTQGQHKGIMLRTLLAKTKAKFDAIVFVDDQARHLTGMQEAFAKRSEDVHTVRYTHELARIVAFQASDKHEAKQQWCQLSQGLEAAFGRKNFRSCGVLGQLPALP